MPKTLSITVPALRLVGAPLKNAWLDTVGHAARRRSAVLALWFGVVWFVLAGDLMQGLAGLCFVLLVLMPGALLVQQWLLSAGIPKIIAQPSACALVLCLAPFVFLLRKMLPLSPTLTDLLICGGVGASSVAFAHFHGNLRPRMPSISRAEALWLALVIPAVFIAPRLGNEVHIGDQVRFYGPSLMDFGNLRVVVNLLNIDPHLVPAPVDACGPLVYHWLFFATPAWMGDFLGFHMDAGPALTLINLVTAVLFFRCLSLCCSTILEKAGVNAGQWGPVGACIGITGASLTYFYMYGAKFLRLSGEDRNLLLLQLPSSISIFGNNTLALCLTLLGLLAVHEWNAEKRIVWLVVAALLVGFVPAMSITLAPSLGLGIGAACLAGVVHRRWLSLTVFAAAAALIGMGLVALDYFTGTQNQVAIGFDNGRFIRNITAAFPLVIAAALWCFVREKTEMTRLFGWGMLGAILAPSFIYLDGSPDVPSTMSMKNATLLVTCGCPLLVFAFAHWFQVGRGRLFSFRNVGLVLIAFGIVNSLGYMIATPLTRLGLSIQPSTAITKDHLSALQHVRRTTARSAVVIDPFSVDNFMSNPANVFAARRVILPSAYDLAWHYTNDLVERRQAAWTAWEQSGFTDESHAAFLAACADSLLAPAVVRSAHWTLDEQCGNVFVYRSVTRSDSARSVAER